jgi:hypothetical protein
VPLNTSTDGGHVKISTSKWNLVPVEDKATPILVNL